MQASSTKAEVQRRLVFRIGEQRHALDADLVLEVVKVPHITRVPHGAEALRGLANLRGRPIAVLSMRGILNGDHSAGPSDGKLIVYEHNGQSVGLLVDDVLRLSADTTETPLDGFDQRLDGAFKFSKPAPSRRADAASRAPDGQASIELTALLSFWVAGQLFGLPLEHIRSVATVSGEVSMVPGADDALIGLVALRDGVLPLVSLASLMGLATREPIGGSYPIVVIEHDGDRVGLVVDEMDAIRRLRKDAIDAVPAVLQRGRGDAQIEAIGRIADGGLLISILSPNRLFGHHAIAEAISRDPGARSVETMSEQNDATEQFLIFELGEERYGLPIKAVDEVIRVPDEVTRVPGAPAFVLGVINLRGRAIPLIDQRSRFETAALAEATKARAIIVTIGSLQAGFVVDAVSEVKAIAASALSAAPEFNSDQTEVFDRVAHIEADDRMLLLVDPQELLSRAERDVVAALARVKNAVADS